MNPFLFLFYIAYLTPSIPGRSLLSPNTDPRKALESSQQSPVEGHMRSKRSLTAFLAAEVLFLEGLLAAQNSRRPRKLARPVLRNTIESNRVKKQVKKTQFVPPPPPSHPPQLIHFRGQHQARPPVSTTTLKPRLDPFIMLSAPDLSKNNYGEYELYQTLHSPSPSGGEPGEPDVVTQPNTTFHSTPASFSARKPRKRTLHYGAFELYHL